MEQVAIAAFRCTTGTARARLANTKLAIWIFLWSEFLLFGR